ncbi:hypothetical protein COS16_02135 [Candidatus Desantisbacteria bacterium CG02_land_8_20_14_3_00_49_13]|nr:MAG: hypothetical protein AUJ67_03525 [Candidatus Desantisbacteria bacterium CG1_02_49_89]PIV57050.1 MAG: hypothetical protein COS16_02135 [Candidatus Desantisbacteria bacterium CG02_land_8_20_14_3_00_49_13]PJB27670.1 MAG: hypothetical protein CO111_04060 [Candidatus Desantisbacteria bacterium CG_4_9_14_3_um_filter_50_7]
MIRFGQIGVGGEGTIYTPIIAENPACRLAAVCDINKEVLDRVAGERKANAYTDFREMIEKEDLDAVAIILPHYLYPEAVGLAAKKNLHILQEKPFARNLPDAKKIVKALKGYKGIYMLSAQRKYSPAFQKAKEIIKSGSIGKVQLIEAYAQYRFTRTSESFGWRTKKKLSGGLAIIDFGWHMLDTIYWIKGMPSRVYANTCGIKALEGKNDIDETANIILEYADGSSAVVLTSITSIGRCWEFTFQCTKGTIKFSPCLVETYDKEKLIEKLDITKTEPEMFAAQFNVFLNAVQTGKKPLTGPAYGLNLSRIAEAAYRSASSGKPVLLKNLTG